MIRTANRLRLIKKFFILLFIIQVYNFSSFDAYAHPGRTDSSGGHTCRTNCESWGLEYGEYHKHNSDSGSNYEDSENNKNNSDGWVWLFVVGGIIWYAVANSDN